MSRKKFNRYSFLYIAIVFTLGLCVAQLQAEDRVKAEGHGKGEHAKQGDKQDSQKLPEPGSVVIDEEKRELILSAKVQFPEDKPCINDYGQRIQAFAGCATAAGGDAKMAAYFVFLVDVETEKVFDGLIDLGCRPRVHYSIQEGRKRSGLKADTKPEDYLQGDPVVLSVFWKDKSGKWVEKAYQHFATEKTTVGDREVEKPWTPHFVFHGSGAIHKSGTGCIACPCDCPGGIIADNRFPIYDPKPVVRFDMSKAPPEGTQVYVRIRPIASLLDDSDPQDADSIDADSSDGDAGPSEEAK